MVRRRQSIFLVEKCWHSSLLDVQYQHNRSSSVVFELKTHLKLRPYTIQCEWNIFHTVLRWNYPWMNSIFIYLQTSSVLLVNLLFQHSTRITLCCYTRVPLQCEIDWFGKWTWLCYKLHSQVQRNLLFCLK